MDHETMMFPKIIQMNIDVYGCIWMYIHESISVSKKYELSAQISYRIQDKQQHQSSTKGPTPLCLERHIFSWTKVKTHATNNWHCLNVFSTLMLGLCLGFWWYAYEQNMRNTENDLLSLDPRVLTLIGAWETLSNPLAPYLIWIEYRYP